MGSTSARRRCRCAEAPYQLHRVATRRLRAAAVAACEIGCARNDQNPSRQGRPLSSTQVRPKAGEAAPDASKPSRQPSFRPTKLPVILPTPHRTPHLGPNGHRSLNCPSKPNNSKAVNTRFPLELEKVAPRTACIVGSLFASAPAGLHDN